MIPYLSTTPKLFNMSPLEIRLKMEHIITKLAAMWAPLNMQ